MKKPSTFALLIELVLNFFEVVIDETGSTIIFYPIQSLPLEPDRENLRLHWLEHRGLFFTSLITSSAFELQRVDVYEDPAS